MRFGKPSSFGRITSAGYIGYTYQVAENEYRGSRVTVATTASAGGFIRYYKRGQMLPVYYDPESPERSLLIPGLTRQALTTVLILAMPFLLGVLSIVVGIGLRNRRFRRYLGCLEN
ncbi:MAG: DUF3592 domain-containing protein [Planctomycetota bacterium]|jgi:hypothetical protein